MPTRRALALAALLAGLLGCARSDWIGSTLVTVDVSGEWRTAPPPRITMTLQQQGAKVSGTYQFAGPGGVIGRVAGTITGDTLNLEGVEGLGGKLTVGVDEMIGFISTPSGGLGGRPGGRYSVRFVRP